MDRPGIGVRDVVLEADTNLRKGWGTVNLPSSLVWCLPPTVTKYPLFAGRDSWTTLCNLYTAMCSPLARMGPGD